MSDFVLSCCSTADLSREFMRERDISYVCFHFQLDGKEYLDDLGMSMDIGEFYRAMEAGAETKTSQINADEFEQYFDGFLAQGKDILHVSLSSGISGVVNSATIAKNSLEEKYPDRKIYIVDSLGASSGYGMIMSKLADMRDAGKSIDEVYEWIMNNRLRFHYWFFTSDLKYLVKGGRVNKAVGLVGSMLNICPLLNISESGELVPRFKVRTKKKVLSTTLEQMEKYADNGTAYDDVCFISHAYAKEDAEVLKEMVEGKFTALKGKIKIFPIGTGIGAHTGPGTVALFFIGEPRKE